MVEELERFLASVERGWIWKSGALTNCETDVDVETVGLAACDVRQPDPVVDVGEVNIADGVDANDVALGSRVACFTPLCAKLSSYVKETASMLYVKETAAHIGLLLVKETAIMSQVDETAHMLYI